MNSLFYGGAVRPRTWIEVVRMYRAIRRTCGGRVGRSVCRRMAEVAVLRIGYHGKEDRERVAGEAEKIHRYIIKQHELSV